MQVRSWIGLVTLAVLVGGCSDSGGSSPTQPGVDSELTVTSADLLVGGTSVAGQTLPPGHGEGMMARFEAHLKLGSAPAPGFAVWAEYDRPMGMGPLHGKFPLYDDGTHGDPVAGDGVYCFEDVEGLYACHRNNAHHGDYHYQFYGMDHAGNETNRMGFTVHIASN